MFRQDRSLRYQILETVCHVVLNLWYKMLFAYGLWGCAKKRHCIPCLGKHIKERENTWKEVKSGLCVFVTPLPAVYWMLTEYWLNWNGQPCYAVLVVSHGQHNSCSNSFPYVSSLQCTPPFLTLFTKLSLRSSKMCFLKFFFLLLTAYDACLPKHSLYLNTALSLSSFPCVLEIKMALHFWQCSLHCLPALSLQGSSDLWLWDALMVNKPRLRKNMTVIIIK